MLRTIRITVAIALLFVLALPAAALDCVQSDGEPGIQLVGVEGDAGCQTADEYAQVFSVDNLIAEGVLTGAVDNGDGTVTVDVAFGGTTTMKADALMRPVAANPGSEPDAPTVGEVLYPRRAFGVHPE
jgi:hypothetical protein